MPTIDPQLLRSIALFSLLDDEELDALAPQLDELKFLGGQLIFAEGDEGGTMFVIQSGRVELFLEDKAGDIVKLGVREKGELFGELSLLDKETRSASAKTLENTVLYRIDRNDLEMLVKGHPHAALDMMAIMGKRIREADYLVQDRVGARNVNDEIPTASSLGERISDFLTMLAGDIRFVYASLIWFFVWIVWNTNIIPGVQAFDPFPFGLLTMVVSLEAIFLSLFVLISQNRQASREKVRNDIEYEVNVKAEVEIRALTKQVDALEQKILEHFADLKHNGQ